MYTASTSLGIKPEPLDPASRALTITPLQLFPEIISHLISLFIPFSVIRCVFQYVDYAQYTCTDQLGNVVNDMVYQTKCSYTCRDGYERDGSETITCQLDETWSPSAPSCQGKKLSIFINYQ